MYNGDFRRHVVELLVVAGVFVAGFSKGITANTLKSGVGERKWWNIYGVMV